MEKLEIRSLTNTETFKKYLQEVFPEVFNEGKINFELLKALVDEEYKSNEQYTFNWNGKIESIKIARSPSVVTLRPDKITSKNWENTNNLYIEGDNLEVLKILEKTYFGKINTIYIDPPYNTGSDFVYKDDFSNTIQNFLDQTNQLFRKNPETNGRFHTDWLNLMFPRLIVAKKLLKEDGVMFISIDENEYENLLKITKEIFGEINYIGTIIWKNRTTPNDAGVNFGVVHEYIVIVSKDRSKIKFRGLDKDLSNYNNNDNDPNGPWIKDNPSAASGNPLKDRFEIINPFTGQVYLPPKGRYWAFSQKRVQEWFESGKLVFPRTENTSFTLKKYLNELRSESKPFPSIIEGILTSQGTKELKDIFYEINDSFKYPKSTELIIKLLEQVSQPNDIILDFFSGSSTTAHAVMQLNAEDGGNRKFIMVQLPERTEETSEAFKAGFNNICEIGKERIRRAGEKIKNELIEKNQKSGILDNLIDPEKLDIGFKVYKLDSSNFNVFDSTSKDINNIFNHDVFLSDRSQLDILYEILLKYGVFDKPVEVLNINNKEAYSVAYGHMLVFINQEITEQDITEVVALKPREVIIDERGFKTDNDKMNAVIRLETAGVEKISTI